MNIFEELNAEWIWLSQEKEQKNQYVNFRHEFILSETKCINEDDGKLYIAIDTEYALWINGRFVDCNQYDDYPQNKSYDVLDIKKYLCKGNNVLCILGYYQGDNSYQYIKGQPGLIYALKVGNDRAISGEKTFCRRSPAYVSGEMEKISPQLAYTFEFDASREDDWLLNAYTMDEKWAMASMNKEMKETVSLYLRPIKKLIQGERSEGRVTAQGFFKRDKNTENPGLTTAQCLQSDYLSARLPMDVFSKDCGYDPRVPCQGLKISNIPDGNVGAYLVIDLMQEESGLFELEIDAEEGVSIEVSYGEQLDDLRVRAYVGGRNFAFKYTCKEGRQKFVHPIKKIAGRYLQLHVSGIKKGVTLYYAGIRAVRYPHEESGRFFCGDRLFNRICEVSAKTLDLCMQEHYVDTPWREQGLYAMDSRNQALCGYYCFGEYDYAEASFSLFAEGLGDDGYLEICAPARDRITIPSFSMGWIVAVEELVLYSGRTEIAARLFPSVKKMLDSYLENMENGLMKAPSGQRYWNFYEWAEGLDGGWTFDTPFVSEESASFDAPLNLFLCLALDAGAKLAAWSGNEKEKTRYLASLKSLKASVHQAFWDDKKQAYQTYIGAKREGHFAELTQGLALCCGTVPEECAGVLRKQLADSENQFVKTTLSYAIFKYEALLQEPDLYGAFVFDDIARDWGSMLYNKATSFWETIRGADEFEKAGSMCHGWSAIPAYFFYAYILGIKPVEPGFKRFSAIADMDVVGRASGAIPTPYGSIIVKRNNSSGEAKYSIEAPEGTARI